MAVPVLAISTASTWSSPPPTTGASRRTWRARPPRSGIPCNVVDVNDLCTFYAPAVLRRGALTITVATDGKFPLLAVALRDRIAAGLADAIAHALELLGEGRTLAVARYPHDPARRVDSLRRLLSPEALESIVEGRLDAFRAHWEVVEGGAFLVRAEDDLAGALSAREAAALLRAGCRRVS